MSAEPHNVASSEDLESYLKEFQELSENCEILKEKAGKYAKHGNLDLKDKTVIELKSSLKRGREILKSCKAELRNNERLDSPKWRKCCANLANSLKQLESDISFLDKQEAPNNDTDAIIHKGETIMSESETVLKSIDAQLSESLQTGQRTLEELSRQEKIIRDSKKKCEEIRADVDIADRHVDAIRRRNCLIL